MVLTLADRSSVFPEDILEDVLVHVNDLVFPADFYVLDMEDDDTLSLRLLLLGRPFLKIARTKIDVHEGTLSMEFDGAAIKFSINEAMKHPNDYSFVFAVNSSDPLTEKFLGLHFDDSLQVVLTESLTEKDLRELGETWVLSPALNHVVADLQAFQLFLQK